MASVPDPLCIALYVENPRFRDLRSARFTLEGEQLQEHLCESSLAQVLLLLLKPPGADKPCGEKPLIRLATATS